eukprot:12643564-Alexandrium_andersonii.AAC.1
MTRRQTAIHMSFSPARIGRAAQYPLPPFFVNYPICTDSGGGMERPKARTEAKAERPSACALEAALRCGRGAGA